MSFFARIAASFRRRKMDADLDEEIRSTLEMLTEQKIREGMPAAEAARAARIELGGAEQVKESVRASRSGAWLGTVAQDIRFALRMLRKNPGFTAVAVLTLTLGIGANAAIFSVVDGVLVQPLPYRQPDELVAATDSYPEGAFSAMRDSVNTMDVAAYREGDELNLTTPEGTERVYGTEVSSNFFSLLGVRPPLGRGFVAGEDQPGNDGAIILRYSLWQQNFQSDPNIIGRSMMLGGINRQIVGVLPADFHFGSSKAQFWVPLRLDPRAIGAYWGGGFMPLIGRLRGGATVEQARAEFRQSLPHLRSLFPWRMPDALWAGATIVPLRTKIVGNVQSKLLILFVATGFVLLIACANVANMLLARAAGKQKELALRAALGAGRWRIARHSLIESVVLAMFGGALALLVATTGLSSLTAILPADTPRLASIAIDWRVMGFAGAAAILAGLILGVVPALQASRVNLIESLKTQTRNSSASPRSHRLQHVLTVIEVALAVMLVAGAGVMLKSLWELSRVNPGFQPESIFSARITPNSAFCADFGRCQSFYASLQARVAALPGVEATATANNLPLNGRWAGYAADVEDHSRDPKEPAPVLYETIVSPDYFRLMGVPLLRGREFNDADMSSSDSSVALVTAATAEKYWPNQNPIGKHIKPVFDKNWTTIVGVVGDVFEDNLASRWPEGVDGAIYEPFGNGPRGKLAAAEKTLVIRGAGNENWAELLRRTVWSLNPEAAVSEPKTLNTIISESMTAQRSTISLFAIFAALALTLGAVGIYGVISYSVSQRTAEIGIRVALGAQRRDVLRIVLGQAAALAGAGVGAGLAGALVTTRLLTSLLYGVQAADPWVYGCVALLMAAVALLASYAPARQAMRVDPVIAMRGE